MSNTNFSSHAGTLPACLWTRCVLLLILLLLQPHETHAFAAAAKKNRKKGKSKNTASNQKGFGAAPPTLQEITSKFKTRLPENAASLPCPCGIVSDDGAVPTYGDCCQPYHLEQKQPETPLRVLQTRYSAFCYRLVSYVIQTTHRSCRDYRENQKVWATDLNRQGMFDSFDFLELQPLGPTEYLDDNQANIEFRVRLKAQSLSPLLDDDEDKPPPRETIVTEKSLFKKDPETNTWSYAGGPVRSEEKGLEGTVLNQ